MYMNIDRYRVIERLLGGSQSTVYVAHDDTVNKRVVLKKVSLAEGAEIPSSLLREASLLCDLRHQNIIRLDRLFVHEESVYMVLEYMETDLRHHMKLEEYRYPAVIKIYLKQMLSAISYCHSHGVLHRDIKPENILVKSCTDDLKIADFGCARGFITPSVTLSPDMTTLTYRAPELLMQSNHYTAAVDIWSVGCVFAEMVYGNKPLFFAGSRTAVLDKIFGLLGTPNEDTWPGVSSLPGFPRDSIPVQPKDLRKFFQYSPLNAAGFDLLTRLLHLNPEEGSLLTMLSPMNTSRLHD